MTKNETARLEKRRYPIGAELLGDGCAHFRVWAPKAKQLEVAIENGAEDNAERAFHSLAPEHAGYFSGTAPAEAGTRYRFRIDRGEKLYPDPASRFQPEGPHRSSMVVDPRAFAWTDEKWKGISLRGQIIYEMHLGTFTREGSWRAAAQQLPELKRAGITVIEVMPIADFGGEFGWGYDGVNLFAPCRLYGKPDDARAFVNEAHSVGLGVILDVVYNHLGPEGNYLRVFADDYFTNRYENDWGDALNFDGENSEPVREFFITNGRYWINEFHFDGFRFDATQSIFDSSKEYIVGAIGRAARAAAGEREIIFIAENEPQETKLLQPKNSGGDDLDGLWNDDLHHTACVALTGRNEAYYADYSGSPQEFISAAKYGYLFQGQHYAWQKQARGMPALDIEPAAFVGFIENHDQVSNSAYGQRVRAETSPGKYRAMTALLLLGPWTPMLFQGQEFGATTPFLYFADVSEELREPVRKGRFEFLTQFPSIASPEIQAQLPTPSDRETFSRCKLDFSERETQRPIYDLHRDLLQLRREDARFREQKFRGVDGAVLNEFAFVLRYFGDENDDRLLLVNFGRRAHLSVVPEPLLAPPFEREWEMIWTSESPRYGGPGAAEIVTDNGWILPAEAAVVLRPRAENRQR